jgi:hypothetical protein
VTGHEGGQGGGASPGDLKLSGVTLGAKEKVGGDKVENQELGAGLLQRGMQGSHQCHYITPGHPWCGRFL